MTLASTRLKAFVQFHLLRRMYQRSTCKGHDSNKVAVAPSTYHMCNLYCKKYMHLYLIQYGMNSIYKLMIDGN